MGSLAGKSILVTRAAHQSAELSELIRRKNGLPLLFPMIEISDPPSWDAADRAIAALYMYDGLIFTSANGVDRFMKRVTETGGEVGPLRSKQVFVVGEKTAQAATKQGLTVTLVPERFTSADLARSIDHRDLTGRSFLFPRGNLGKEFVADALTLIGANVDSVVVYETRKPQEEALAPVREQLLRGEVDVLTFTSPSTFQNFIDCFSKEEMRQIAGRCVIAVIGPVTAASVREEGFEPRCIAGESTIEALVEAIIGSIGEEAVGSGNAPRGEGRRR